MQFKKVNREDIQVPRVNMRLQSMIEEFMDSDADVVEVIFSEREYKSSNTCCAAWRCAIARSKRRLKVCQRNGHIYLEKLDHD